MRLLQNILVTDTDNARFFESLFLSWKNSLIVPEWAQVWQSSWCHLRKCFSSTNFTILISWSPVCTPLIPCHYHWNVWVMTLVANATTYWNMKIGKSCKITSIRVNGSDDLFSFLDWLLLCAIHIRQMKLSWNIRNGNKKFQTTMLKALLEFY